MTGAASVALAVATLAATAFAPARVAGAAMPAGDTLTVADCVAIAREQAPARVAAGHLLRAAARDSAAEALNGRPAFSLRAGAWVAPSGFYDPVVTNLGEYEVKAALDWPLADGGARARMRTRGGLEAASARLRAAVESRDAGLRAGALALRLVSLAETDRVLERTLDWLDALATIVRGGVASGQRGSADSIRVALERDAVVSALEDARLEASNSTLELRGLLDRPGAGALTILPSAAPGDAGPAELDSLRLASLAGRLPESALTRIEEQQRRLDLEDAAHRQAPSVDMSLDAGLGGADLSRSVPEALRLSKPDATFADRLRQDLGASVAVHVQLPVLDGSKRRRLDARRAALDAATIAARADADAQQRRVAGLIAEWRSASRRLQATEITYGRAERNVLKVKSLYTAGATTLLDLLDARRVLDDARDRRAAAREAVQWARLQAEEWQ